jgi:hypothetical protein
MAVQRLSKEWKETAKTKKAIDNPDTEIILYPPVTHFLPIYRSLYHNHSLIHHYDCIWHGMMVG